VLKSKLLVYANGGRVPAIADNSDELPAAPFFACPNKVRKEKRAGSVACMIVLDVHRVFEGKSIGDTRAVDCRVCVADDLVVALSDEIGKSASDHVEAAAGHFAGIRRIDFNGTCTVEDVIGINAGDGSHIRVLRRTYLYL
jgi:hypothetical protein